MAPGVSFDIAFGRNYHVPYNYWRFVRERDFGRRNIYNYYIDNSTNTTIINNYTVINNFREDRSGHTRYNAGPDRREVERFTGRTFSPVAIKESSKPAQDITNNQLVLYKPRVEKTEPTAHKPAPANVVKLENLKSTASINTRENMPGKSEGVKQPQGDKQTVKPEAIKQPQDIKPSGKKQEAKPMQEVKPSGSPDSGKQPREGGHSRNTSGGKQHDTSPSKKTEK